MKKDSCSKLQLSFIKYYVRIDSELALLISSNTTTYGPMKSRSSQASEHLCTLVQYMISS